MTTKNALYIVKPFCLGLLSLLLLAGCGGQSSFAYKCRKHIKPCQKTA